MITESTIKVIGIATGLVGIGVSIAEGIISDKKMEMAVDKKIAEALAKMITEA